MRIAVLALLLVGACTDAKTVVDPQVTAIEVATQLDANDGITQLRLSGTIDGVSAFAPGLVPDVPRALAGDQSAVIVLPDTLDGSEVMVRVDALAGDTLVHSGGRAFTIHAHAKGHVDVALGAPAICGDGHVSDQIEPCDDGNVLAGDGCTATCTLEPGWRCSGEPSACQHHDDAKEITAFGFGSINNAVLAADVRATITGTAISLTVPNGTNVGALVATFTSTGAGVTVNGVAQVTGTTSNDFSAPVTYHVAAIDGSTKDYTVMVTIASNTAKELTSFAFLASENTNLAADAMATITGTTIAVTLPANTAVGALVATFATTGASVMIASAPQTSGVTANDFANPVIYRVTAADLSTRDYTVTVEVAASSEKELTSFDFMSVHNAGLGADVTGTINGTDVALTVPAGTDVTALVPTFSASAASVTVGGHTQISGATAESFTSPVAYHLVAADGSSQDYTVTVTVAPSSSKDLTLYGFLTVNNSNLSADVLATISGTDIALTVPAATKVTALVATFSSTGATVTVAGVSQTSDVTANDFTHPVIYRVTAADGSSKDFTVTVTIAPSTAKEITAFSFLTVDNAGLGHNVIGAITGTNIALTVRSGMNVKKLVATFATTGTSVTVGGVVQVSGTTRNNFTNPVVYRVVAGDGSTQDYTVTVSSN